MKHYIKLLRPEQWIKNLFVFAPLFFSNNVLNMDYVIPALYTFFAFCFISSSIYCFNDIIDLEKDKKHYRKCKRPIASGKISTKQGYILMILCSILSFSLIGFSNSENIIQLYMIIGGYFILNIAYCLKLKQFAIIDVMSISIGFVLRVLSGGISTGIWISQWLVMMTFLISLFLAFSKRNDDFFIFEKTGEKPRLSITGYNNAFIHEATAIVAAITLVCYIMYTVSPDVIERMGTNYVYLTSGWVLVGLLRYLQKMIVYEQSGSPTQALIKDRFIQICVVGWILSFYCIIYL